MRPIRLLALLLLVAVIAPGAARAETAAVDVAVATLWKAPNLARAIDRPSLDNPVDPDAWSRNLATTQLRVWLDSHVQTQALYGQTVVVLARMGAWAKVAVVDEPDPQNPHGYPGWLPVSQLRRGFNHSGRTVVVVARTTELDVQGRTLTLSYGTRLPLVRWSGDVAVVRTPDGEGTLAAGEAREPLVPSGASIVAQARRFLGVRYLWGGLSSWGFDCSGLVWDVFRVHGLTIPRDADPQFRSGLRVPVAALRPGDLLFYGTQSYVHHVTIYAGGGRMLEAPDSAHRVRLVLVRWGGLVGARRYI
ncbi:MAG: NlpC/P60 family protein [Gaiellaceae bacterium]